MKIADFIRLPEAAPAIRYRVSSVGPTSDFEDAVEAKLYVRKMSFLGWYLRPETFFKEGGVAVRAYAGDALIGIGMLNANAFYFRMNYHPPIDPNTQNFLGMIGFFVRDEHRAKGIARNLAQHLERAILKGYRDTRVPVAICTGMACDVARSAFQRIEIIKAR